MSTLKIVVDGQTYELREGTYRVEEDGTIILKSKEEMKRSPFERTQKGGDFYFISGAETLLTAQEHPCHWPDMYYDCANYCTDAELLRRRALYEKLERCLWRFSMENGGSGDYYPILNRENRMWVVNNSGSSYQRFGPSFKTSKICQRAIEEVIKPIMEGTAEEEIFVWRGV